MGKSGDKTKAPDVVTRDYTINLHKRLFRRFVSRDLEDSSLSRLVPFKTKEIRF